MQFQNCIMEFFCRIMKMVYGSRVGMGRTMEACSGSEVDVPDYFLRLAAHIAFPEALAVAEHQADALVGGKVALVGVCRGQGAEERLVAVEAGEVGASEAHADPSEAHLVGVDKREEVFAVALRPQDVARREVAVHHLAFVQLGGKGGKGTNQFAGLFDVEVGKLVALVLVVNLHAYEVGVADESVAAFLYVGDGLGRVDADFGQLVGVDVGAESLGLAQAERVDQFVEEPGLVVALHVNPKSRFNLELLYQVSSVEQYHAFVAGHHSRNVLHDGTQLLE